MSTRRARIKAVTSLPTRRKNTEAADNKNKQIQSKEIPEKVPKSPRTPKSSLASNQEQNVTPHVKSTFDPQTINDKTTCSKIIKTPNIHEKSTPLRLTTSKDSPLRENSSLHSEKSLTNDHPTVKNNVVNVFASPLRKDSPKQTFASPFIPSPKPHKNVELQKPATPLKIPTPISQKISETNELQIADNIVSNIRHKVKTKTSHADNSANVTENDDTMDGIVPLQPAGTLHKPIDLLKNEIISENAEVLFDPIVPLPSPSKVRPKLRPVPRLGPLRRNSVQGSASESEDESRRNLYGSSASRQRHDSHTSHSTHQSIPNRDVSRIRNDSVCSGVSQIAQPLVPGSPVREKQSMRAKRQEMTRRATKRRRENVKRDTLTMYDLIFYNPTTNPIVPDDDEVNIQEANVKEELERTKKKEELERIKKDQENEPKSENNNAAPVPQIKLGPKGEIILDEESLVIKQTDSGRSVSSVVHEGAWSSGNGYKHKRGPRSAEWSAAETVRFYRALAAIGTDFTLMAPLFPDRNRRELKMKFKKEEKSNGAQVDKALCAPVLWDAMKLNDEFKEERLEAAKRLERERERLRGEKQAERARLKSAREVGVRPSKGAKALESTMMPGMMNQPPDAITAADIIERVKQTKPNQRKRQTKSQIALESKLRPIPALTPLKKPTKNQVTTPQPEMATISKLPSPFIRTKTPDVINALPQIPSNIETGSLVVLTVNDPSSPGKTMLQTYIANGHGKLTPVALPTVLLNSVVGYMKKGTPKSVYSTSSPQILSPNSVTSHDSRTSTPGVTVMPSPNKKLRHNSITFTQL